MVKANYVKLGGPEGAAEARGRVKASARYYGHRPDEDGRREWRDAFSGDRDRMSKEEAYEQVLGAEGEYAYRIVLSPGREMSEGDLMEWTRDVMDLGAERGWFEEDRGAGEWASEEDSEGEAERWVAWAHTDHTDNPHVHVLAFTDRRLDREDFAGMREEGDLAVEQRLDWRAEVEQDQMDEAGLDREPDRWEELDGDEEERSGADRRSVRTRPYRFERWARDFGTGGEDENARVDSTSEVFVHYGWSPGPSTEEEREELEMFWQLVDTDVQAQFDEEHEEAAKEWEQAVQEREQAARGYEHEEEQGWE